MKLTSVLPYGGKYVLWLEDTAHQKKKKTPLHWKVSCVFIYYGLHWNIVATCLINVSLNVVTNLILNESISDFICLCLSHFRTAAWSVTRYIFPFRWLVDMRWYWTCAHLLINRWHQRAYLYKSIPYCLVKRNQFWLLIPMRTRSQLSSRWPMLITASFMESFGKKNLPHPLSLSNNLVYASTFLPTFTPYFSAIFKTYYVKAVYVTWNWHVF